MVHSLTGAAVALLLVVAAAAAMPEDPAITYATGSITGKRLRSAGLRGEARDYAAFWGIPFAEPPVGALRFKPPVLLDLPEKQFDGTNAQKPMCIQQRRTSQVVGEEDCLYLQVFTPNYDTAANLPVVVLIHGGGFMFGAAPRSGFEYIMDYDVVLVVISYRLNIFGFMSFEDDALRGNVGMLDQVAALTWVQRNVHHFGGNSQSVTLVGNSAGSASCLLHTMSPLSKGLFHKIISTSGTPLNPWAQQHSGKEYAHRVADLTGCRGSSTTELVDCLRTKAADELAGLQAEHFQGWMLNPFSPFTVEVDGTFLPEKPETLLDKPEAVMDIPLLLGFVPLEGLFPSGDFILNNSLLRELDEKWETLAPLLLHFHDARLPEADRPLLARRIREHYLGKLSLESGTQQFIKIMTDGNFLSGLSSHISKRASAQTQPVFAYEFAHRGEYSGYPGDFGVGHGDDMQYPIVTRSSGVFHRQDDLLVRTAILDMWFAFIQTSNPSLPGMTWDPVPRGAAEAELSFLRITGPYDMVMVQERDVGNVAFWKGWRTIPNLSVRLQSSLGSIFVVTIGAILFANVL